ncbi:chymotrypsin-elastase inhibitor ixodidin-like isoform X2 [Chelonus insularis]|uniref:chymotrypsin-elastase inhibitor ixodidin-like isoform X2 n=1 Tax=Chelonus insularis TaxID=460826 RepID=UPI001588FE22|nr:chymotrypsin-elastase inhibitor ixodidin-like isoform X2 [Chelonus insularis]
MNSKIITISIAITAIIMIALKPVHSQGCADVECTGGPYDKCFECGSACPLTCDNPSMEGKACIMVCMQNVCQCTQGTVRGPNGKCIDASECPAKSS